MRIGHFLSHFPEPGGTTTMLLGLSSGLIDQGHDVFAYGYGGDASDRSGSATVQVLKDSDEIGMVVRVFNGRSGRFPYLLGKPDDLTSWLSLNRDDLDVLLIHGAFTVFSPAVARSAKQGGIIRIACPHDPYSPAIFGTHTLRKRAYWKLVEGPFLSRVDGIHLLAPSHEGYLRGLGVSTPTFVVPNGLDRRQKKAPRSELTVPTRRGGDLRLLYVGRWDIYNKGLDLLLAAIARARSDLRIRLDFAGRATRKERSDLLELIASVDAGDEVSIAGFVPSITEAMSEADAVVLPSRFDGFGQVVLEALSLGTPVIISSMAGAAEYFGEDDGVAVVEPTVPALVEALHFLNRARDQLRAAARSSRSRLHHGFDWTRLAARWADDVRLIVPKLRA